MLLLIDKTDTAKIMRHMLCLMGIISEEISPEERSILPAECYRSTVIFYPERMSEGELKALLSRFADSALYAVSEFSGGALKMHAELDGIFNQVLTAADLVRNLNEASRVPLGAYRIGELDASVNICGACLGRTKINFTKTELMLLRSLICAHPRGLYAKGLLYLATKPGKTPLPSNIRTHISVMNKKFRYLTGKKLIVSSPSGQYSLSNEALHSMPHADLAVQ